MDFHSPSLQQFRDQIARELSLLMEGLWDAPKALLVRFLQESTGKNIVILTAESKMSKLLDDAAYFKISEIMEFPAWETLPEKRSLRVPTSSANDSPFCTSS